jgi:hypothetical protein
MKQSIRQLPGVFEKRAASEGIAVADRKRVAAAIRKVVGAILAHFDGH